MEDPNPREIDRPKRVRRTHSKAFKAQLIALAEAGEVSVAKIAMDHSINANQLRKWINDSHPMPENLNMVPVCVVENSLTRSSSAAGTVVMELTINSSAIRIHHAWDPLAVAALIKALQ